MIGLGEAILSAMLLYLFGSLFVFALVALGIYVWVATDWGI